LVQLIMDCRGKPGNDNIEGYAFDVLKEPQMTTLPPIEYADASPQVRAVYDDIKKTRNVPDVNNFWKYLARDPVTLKRTWESVKEVMAPGVLEPLLKEMIYVSSVSDQRLLLLHCHSYRRSAQGGHDRADVWRADGCCRHGQ
jgi:hypothetical protein